MNDPKLFAKRGLAAQEAVNKVLARWEVETNGPLPMRTLEMDLCIAGEGAINGICGDPECVCAPESLKQLPRCCHGHPIGSIQETQYTQYGCDICAEVFSNRSQNRSKLQYVAKHGKILQGTFNVATARSHTFAKLIAKALNQLQEK